jgi:hypothetical protein
MQRPLRVSQACCQGKQSAAERLFAEQFHKVALSAGGSPTVLHEVSFRVGSPVHTPSLSEGAGCNSVA